MNDLKSPSPTNIDELKAHAGKIVRLMADPEPGMMVWNLMVADAVRGIISLTGAPPDPRSQRMEMALKAVLLFHKGNWHDDAKMEWTNLSVGILGTSYERKKMSLRSLGPIEMERIDAPYEATTRILCDMVRAALKEDV